MKDRKARAQHSIRLGATYPYDATDQWKEEESMETPPPRPDDDAHLAARGIIADLMDRAVIKHGFNRVDETVRIQIVSDIADIIREVFPRTID